MNFHNPESNRDPQQDHSLKITDRKSVDITGVREVDSFDHEEFLLETVLGYLVVRGQNLQLKNLDVEAGIVTIEGKVYELSYIDEQHQGEAKGFFSKLIK